MYIDQKYKKDHETKVRLSDPVESIALREATRAGVQKAVWMRHIIEQYLADCGHEIPGREPSEKRRAG